MKKARCLDYAGYALFRLVELITRILPETAIPRVARMLGRFTYLILVSQKKVIGQGLEIAFGDSKSSTDIDEMVKKNFIHMAQTFFEIIQLARLNRKSFGTLVQYSEGSLETFKRLSEKEKGIIIITAHYGNWEILARSMANLGIKEHIVYRPLDNPLLTAWINRLRKSYPSELISREEALEKSAQILSNNEVIVLAMDQNQAKGGIFVPFFGQLAATARGAAVLAKRFNAPVMAVYARRHCNNKHIICFKEIKIAESSTIKDFVQQNTELFTRYIEKIIREEPTQWLWAHPRWKTRPITEKTPLQKRDGVESKIYPSTRACVSD